MKSLTLAALAALTAALAACNAPKPPPVPPAPAAASDTGPTTPAGPILSGGLSMRPEAPGFYLDTIGAAVDPVNHQPAVTPGAKPIHIAGFGFDPVSRLPAKGVDILIDGKPYPTTYGSPRKDVPRYTKVDALLPVGFSATLPPGALDNGEHILAARVIAADGSGYFESPQFKFQVQ